MASISVVSLWIPVRRPTLISLDLSLSPLIGIIGKRKIITCIQETTRANLERLRSARLIHHDQMITTSHVKALNKANELISLLAPILSTIKHDFSHIKLISMIRFASYSKHANVSKQYWLSLSNDYKVLLWNDCNMQESPMSKSVAETWATFNLARVTTWQHDTQESRRHHEWPQFMMRSKSQARSYITLVHVFHVIPQRASMGCPCTMLMYTLKVC
jgi:hypothetical protein